MSTLAFRHRDLRIALHDGDDVTADRFGDLDEHETDRAASDDGYRVSNLDARLVQAAEHASQWLRHGGIFKRHMRWNRQHVRFNDAARYADVFGICAVVEKQIFAEVFLMLRTVETHPAGSGVESHDAHTPLEPANTGTNFLNHTSEFVTKKRGRHDHASMVAALVDLQVSAASEGDLDLDEHLPLVDARDRNLLDFYVFFAVQDGSRHFSVHFTFPSQTLSG